MILGWLTMWIEQWFLSGRFKELVERSATKSGAEAPLKLLLEEVLSNVTQDWMKQLGAKEHEVKAAQHQMKAAQIALKEAEKERYEALREREESRNALPVYNVQEGKIHVLFNTSLWLQLIWSNIIWVKNKAHSHRTELSTQSCNVIETWSMFQLFWTILQQSFDDLKRHSQLPQGTNVQTLKIHSSIFRSLHMYRVEWVLVNLISGQQYANCQVFESLISVKHETQLVL